MPTTISPHVFEAFPNEDWESATPATLAEAVSSVRKLAGDGLWRVATLLTKEESIRREPRPWASFDVSYGNREKEAQRAAREFFDTFLRIATVNRALITSSPVMWAYGQAHALLSKEFGFSNSVQKFVQIKHWIKEYCDGRDQTDVFTLKSNEDWKQYFFRENWHAPAWLKAWASKYFGNNSSLWDRLDDQNAFRGLDKEHTEKLLDGVAERFWLRIEVALEDMARLASIDLASQGAIRPTTPDSQVETTAQTRQSSQGIPPSSLTERQNSCIRAGDLWFATFEGRTCHLRHQLGLMYIARLLEKPGQEFKASEIRALTTRIPETGESSAPSETTVSDEFVPQERLDMRALRQYRERLSELDDELAHAQANNDLGKSERLRIERDQILEHLKSNIGLGGRSRVFDSHRERARKSVSNAIGKAIDAILAQDPNFAEYLRKNIKTGYTFSYRDTHTRWEISVR